MLTNLELDVANALTEDLYRPNSIREAVVLAGIRHELDSAYPGELVHPRRMDVQYILPRRNGRDFFLNIEINRGGAYSELKRSRMLDPHLVERCDRIYGHSNYLNVMVVGAKVNPDTQRHRELARYFTPNRTYNLWVIMCSEAFSEPDIEFVGDRLRNMARKVMGLE